MAGNPVPLCAATRRPRWDGNSNGSVSVPYPSRSGCRASVFLARRDAPATAQGRSLHLSELAKTSTQLCISPAGRMRVPPEPIDNCPGLWVGRDLPAHDASATRARWTRMRRGKALDALFSIRYGHANCPPPDLPLGAPVGLFFPGDNAKRTCHQTRCFVH